MSEDISSLEAKEPDEPERALDLSELKQLLGYALRRAQVAVFDDFIRSFERQDIRPTQYGVLAAIESNPGSSQATIAEALGIKRSNFVRLIDEFERRGWVVRRAVEDDKRANALHLTAVGLSALAELHAIRAEHEARLAAAVGTPDEVRVLLEQLGRLAALGDAVRR